MLLSAWLGELVFVGFSMANFSFQSERVEVETADSSECVEKQPVRISHSKKMRRARRICLLGEKINCF